MAITLETTLKLFLGYPYSLLISDNHSSFFFFLFLKMIIWLALKLFFCYNVLLFPGYFVPPSKDFRGGVMFFTKAKVQW